MELVFIKHNSAFVNNYLNMLFGRKKKKTRPESV